MLDWLWKVGKDYGPFALLIAYVLWDSHWRERRYITIIETLSESFQQIKKDVEIIKERLWKS